MKRIVFLCLLMVIIFSLVGCNSKTVSETKSPVVINMPTDDSVNGYRVSSPVTSSAEMPDTISGTETEVQKESDKQKNKSSSFCGNKNSKVFHKSSCSSVSKMKDENKVFLSGRDAFISQGYSPCKACNP